MSQSRFASRVGGVQGVTVSFGDRFQSSSQFDIVFREGMELVEETASYLDTEGRSHSKKLDAALRMVYSSESMRLTTRLLDLASWLLIRRALKSGEITEAEARAKLKRIKFMAMSRPSHITRFDELPSGLQRLITDSCALYDRIVKLDRSMRGFHQDQTNAADLAAGAVTNPVNQQLDMLRKAFSH